MAGIWRERSGGGAHQARQPRRVIEINPRPEASTFEGLEGQPFVANWRAPARQCFPESVFDDAGQGPAGFRCEALGLPEELVVQANGSSHASKHIIRSSV